MYVGSSNLSMTTRRTGARLASCFHAADMRMSDEQQEARDLAVSVMWRLKNPLVKGDTIDPRLRKRFNKFFPTTPGG